MSIFNLYKPIGISPLDLINDFRKKNPKIKDEKMTYAGRLDPIAEGVLIVLNGKDVYEKERYLYLDKEYEAEILFGFETDTYDLLGIPLRGRAQKEPEREGIEKILRGFKGEISLPFPKFSSYKIKGKSKKYFIAKINIGCSGGTYVRSIAHELGKKLGSGAVLFGLSRTRVGRFYAVDRAGII